MTAPVPNTPDPTAPAPVPGIAPVPGGEAPPNPLIAAPPAPVPPAPAGGEPQPTPEQLAAELATLRARNEELEPLATAAEEAAAAAREAEEAERTDLERANDRARTLEEDLAAERLANERLALAVDHSIPKDYQQFIVGGTPEERQTNAALLSDLIGRAAGAAQAPATLAPPSQRPVQTLRPGASPTPAPAPDHSYPAGWN